MSKLLIPLALVALAQGQSQGFVSKSNVDMVSRVLNSDASTENLVFSPFSLLIGFGMLYEGLGGSTRKNFGQALGFPEDDTLFRQGFENSIPFESTSNSTKYANMVVVEESANIDQDYGQVMVDTFKANAYRHPFTKRPKLAENSINKRIYDISNNKIEDLLPQGSVTTDTKVVLVNVIYFKSDWQTEFTDSTQKEFNLANGNQVDVNMMYGDMDVGYRGPAGRNHEIVSLPFKDNRHTMVVVLPSVNLGVDGLLQELRGQSSDLFSTVSDPSRLEQVRAAVEMPKFKAERKLEMKSVFSSVRGLNEIFGDNADFTRMASNSKGFRIDDIYHQAIVDVNEKGVEAVGATGLTISVKAFFSPDVEVSINRPFLYFIVDKEKKNIVFAGRMDNPSL